MKNNIIVCTAKPYEIEMDDGKKLTVKDDIYIGTINPNNEEDYFYGAWFDKSEETFPSAFQGSLSFTKEEFKERIETVKDLEGKEINLNDGAF